MNASSIIHSLRICDNFVWQGITVKVGLKESFDILHTKSYEDVIDIEMKWGQAKYGTSL